MSELTGGRVSVLCVADAGLTGHERDAAQVWWALYLTYGAPGRGA